VETWLDNCRVFIGTLKVVQTIDVVGDTSARAAMNNLTEALITFDKGGYIKFCNPFAERMFVCTTSDVIGSSITRFIPVFDDEYLREDDKHIIGRGCEMEAKRNDGSKFPINIFVTKIMIYGDPHYVGLVRDLSDYHTMLTDIRAALSSQTNFIARMSHELRTPLNGIVGMSDILQHTDLTDEQLGMVKTITQSGQLLVQMVNNILDFSKLAACKVSLEYLPFNLNTMVYWSCPCQGSADICDISK
jgi:PAS domain S-box-containing protein